MRLAAIIPAKALNVVFVSNFYDYPLTGLCRLNGKLCWFDSISHKRFKIFSLNVAEKAEKLFDKWIFEALVGVHWSTKPRRRWGDRKPAWLRNFLSNAYYAINGDAPFRRLFK